ncbi:MAG TPA: Gfo/Idh/MocA family oxidoreductase [Gemmataceae bacterium]|nr:Gfo/Idh/MocA family oxidoreductase [Gemmataceae bacterium]
MNRRRFLHMSAALAAAPLAFADESKKPLSERLNIGVVGCGEKSQGEYNLHNVASENIYALCDVDENRAAKARAEFPQAKFFTDYRRLLDLKEIDAVVCATPDQMHAFVGVAAMRAGKHLYCEKPLAHSVAEVRLMRKTAAAMGVVTQMGTQIHAKDNYRRAVEIVQAGVLGPVERVHVWCDRRPDRRMLSKTKLDVPSGFDWDLWLGPAPQQDYDTAFVPFHWRWFWDFGGGELADMACHFMDLPHWALGLTTPLTVAAAGKKIKDGDQQTPDLLQVDYTYPARGDQPKVHLTWYNGVPGPDLEAAEPYHGFRNGVLFEGSKGRLMADYDHLKLLPEEQFADFTPPKPTIPPSIGHHKEWIDAIRGAGTTLCHFGYSGPLAETVLLGNVAYRSGKTIAWDEKAGKTDSAEADAYLQREYRKGWAL